MVEFSLGYREVIPDQTVLDPWKEISVNTGGTQGTLQDIKVAESANGFCYRDSTKHHTRNRFIYWRISHDILELVEHSLDVNLAHNRVRYKFVDTPILNGVSIHETYENVIVLVPTVCSVHRLVFPHPNKYHKQDDLLGTHPNLAAPSIFLEASVVNTRDPSTFHFFTSASTSSSQLPYLAASSLTLTEEEEAIFVLAYPSTEILLVKQSRDGKTETSQLKNESIVPRFLSGLADKLRQKDKDGDTTVSLLLHTFGLETYALTLCRNGQLKCWSCTRTECVAVIDIIAEAGDMSRNQIQGAQNHILRKAVDGYDTECLLAVFMSFSAESQMHVFKPIVNGPQIKLVRLNTLHLPQNDLIDFSLSTSRIWSVWRGKDGDCQVYTACIPQSANHQGGFASGNCFNSHWTPVVLETVPVHDQPPNSVSVQAMMTSSLRDGGPGGYSGGGGSSLSDDSVGASGGGKGGNAASADPKQIYLQHIFHPGRFPLHIISKALNIYKRSTIIGDINLSAAGLKHQICQAVEDEIQNELKETVVGYEDYLEAAHGCWQRLYSCCVQYHVAGLKPLGVLLMPESSSAVLLKKSMVSFLRPLDVFEHMLYNNEHVYKDQFGKDDAMLVDNVDITEDVLSLFKVIDYLDSQMTEVFACTFEMELSMLKSPDVVMSTLLEKIQREMDNEFTDYVAQMLGKCTDLYQAMHKILELVRSENPAHPGDNSQEDADQTTKDQQSNNAINCIFTSQFGISLMAGCLRQQAQSRLSICRNLLLINSILLERKEMDWYILEAIRSVCTPEIVVLTQANYVAVWLSGLPALATVPTETAMQRLSSLKLTPAFNLRTNSTNVISLLELFTGSTGGYEARKLFSRLKHDEENLAHWHLSLLPYLNSLFHIIWPISGRPVLGEWLLSCGQHIWLQQYVRLLSQWCEWNSCTHSFLLATCLLTSGEFYKAQELYQIAAKGIFSEDFLACRVLTYSDDETDPKAYVSYYLKVINLFELHKSLDCAISLANTALSVTTPEDPLAATLYSIKFKHHLALKNYEMAYDSLNSNPDLERRKDNLRDLVKRLLDEKKLDVLMSFTYGAMEELFCNIIFARARAADAISNVYYDFLYAYQVKRGPSFLRLAASTMYEQAFRLNNSLNGDCDAIEKQVKCYLAAKNALQLCDPKHAYIVTPVEQVEEEIIKLPVLAGSNEEPEEIVLRRQINIVTLNVLRKELILASARLKLLRFNPRNFLNLTTPGELVLILTADGLFRTALEICRVYDLDYKVVFEALTKRCGMLNRQNEPTAWKWLIENDVQDLPANAKNAAAAAWNLLQDLVQEYDGKDSRSTVVHKVVVKQIIKMHMFIPCWLLASYKRRNPSELFRLLYTSGRLEEASEVASEYMKAALGYGKEYYGLTHSMQPVKPSLCLPIRAFLSLIEQLRHINDTDPDKPYAKEYEHLKGVFDAYIETARRTTNEMTEYGMSMMDYCK